MSIDISKKEERAVIEDEFRIFHLRYLTLLDQASDPIMITNQKGDFLEVNSSLCKLFGYIKEELLGSNISKLMDPHQLENDPIRFDLLIAGQSILRERRMIDRKGKIIEVEANVKLLPDGMILAIARDITDRKIIEEKIRKSEQDFRLLIEQASDGIFISVEDGSIIDVNSYGCKLIGFSRDELLKMRIPDLFFREDIEKMPLKFSDLVQGKTVLTERRIKREDGVAVDVETNTKMLSDRRILGIMRDITERKRIEKALRESEYKFRKIVENAPVAIASYVENENRDLVFANKKFEALSGYNLDEFPTVDIFRHLIFPNENYRKWVYDTWTVNNAQRIEVEIRNKNGEVKNIEASKAMYENQIYVIANDITDRKKAAEEMRISEEKYRRMFYENPFPVWIYDIENLKILEVNHAAIQKYGYEKAEFSSLTLKDIVSQDDLTALLEFVSQRKRKHNGQKKLWNYLKKNGETMVGELAFYPIDYLGRKAMQVQINDVTEKIRLEKILEQQKKLKQKHIAKAVLLAEEKERSELGKELHDNINQILAASKMFINTALNAKSLRRNLLVQSMDNLSLAIEEIRKLSKSLITPQIKEIGLVESIKDLVDLVLTVNKMKIKFDIKKLDENKLNKDCKIAIYRIVQEQLNNIIKYSKATSLKIQLLNEGQRVNLNISDNGKGFDPKVRRKGIGITNIISRAELYNGHVHIDSAPGKGCRLEVVLNSKDVKQAK